MMRLWLYIFGISGIVRPFSLLFSHSISFVGFKVYRNHIEEDVERLINSLAQSYGTKGNRDLNMHENEKPAEHAWNFAHHRP